MRNKANLNKINLFIFIIALKIIFILFLICWKKNNVEEPFVTYLNSKRHELFRNVRYRSQYAKKYLDNFIRKIKKLF